MLGTYALSAGYYDAYYLKAQKVRTLIRQDFDRAFETVDVILTPTTPSTAFRLGEKVDDPLQMYLADVFTLTVSLGRSGGKCAVRLRRSRAADRNANHRSGARRGDCAPHRRRLPARDGLAHPEARSSEKQLTTAKSSEEQRQFGARSSLLFCCFWLLLAALSPFLAVASSTCASRQGRAHRLRARLVVDPLRPVDHVLRDAVERVVVHRSRLSA